MSASNKGPGIDSRLQNLTNALYVDGNNDIVVRTGFAGNIVISGNVNVPGVVTVNSSPENPNHVHLSEVGTSGILNVPWLPVSGNVRLDSGTNSIGNVRITDGSITVTNFPAFPSNVNITSLPGITGHVTVDNFPSNVNITSLPGIAVTNFPGNVSITALPSITGNVGVSGNVDVTRMPAVTGNVQVYGNVSVDNFPTSFNIGTMPDVEIKNDAGNPITITGNVSTIGGSAQGKLWTMQIAQGLIAGHTVEQVTGYNPTTSAGDAVWSGGTAFPWSSFATAQTLYLKSSTNNATDRSMSILIDGLDANYANQTEVITLNASDSRTAVVSTKQFLRIHNIQCNGADTNVGDIITTVTSGTGTVVSKISAGRGSARAGCFTIPAGYTGYLFKGDASSTAATVVNFMARYYGKAFMVVHVAIVDNSTYIYDFPFPMPLPEKTDMYCTIEAGSGKTAVNYEILLVAS